MKRKLRIVSFFVAAVILSMSCISVISHQTVYANEKESSSPLFAVRTQRATQSIRQGVTAMYIGKEKQLHIFPLHAQNEDIIIKALNFFHTNPSLLNKLLNKLDQFPFITGLLATYGINKAEIKNYMKIIQHNPSAAFEEISDIQNVIPSDDNPQQPLGLSTSNPLACFIMGMIVLVPLTAVLTLLSLVFTLRILTCLNINDCANTIANQIWDQLIQGLTPG